MKLLSLFLLLLVTSAAMAQTKGNGKLYGYKQGVAPGIVLKDLQEDGTETAREPRARTNYYIYLVTPIRAYPTELWVNGELYSPAVRSIVKTPVEQTDSRDPSEPARKVLVPQTNQRVIQLTAMPSTGALKSKTGKTMAATHELVVVYRQGGKFYYQALSKLSELDGAAMQEKRRAGKTTSPF